MWILQVVIIVCVYNYMHGYCTQYIVYIQIQTILIYIYIVTKPRWFIKRDLPNMATYLFEYIRISIYIYAQF